MNPFKLGEIQITESKILIVEGVDEAYSVYGVYDIIVKVRSNSMEKLKDIVTWRVRRLNKVRSTLSMIVIESL